MQIRLANFNLPVWGSIRFLLFTVLLSTGVHTVSLAACADSDSQVKQAMQANDLDRLEKLLALLNRQSDCSIAHLNSVENHIAHIVVTQANELVQQDRFAEAEKRLKRASTVVWNIQVVYGEIAAHRKQWQLAAQFFNQALDLVNDPQATPKAPLPKEIKKLYQFAQEAQQLAGGLGSTISRSGKASGMMRGSVRGVRPKKRLVPILFEFKRTTLSKKGRKSVKKLASYIKWRGITNVTLVGHSDSKGSYVACDRVSKKRAKVVKKYLQTLVDTKKIKIRAIGKGKREPLQVANRWKLTPAELDTLNRRVEFK